ncbi:hypothetical protein L6164_031049 [Bauhinia variegata]|uniref:Uncharacterized protein n=1 Tax=Bauhinia variegata TaxID=167791 RepID=A0ACB9LDU0_BAUVA|nr:hypothetical protein L6164_031049 [Bauhinia variegata]
MWLVELCLAGVLLLLYYILLIIIKWRNPKCNGVLPPGSMGLPLIGETLQLLTPSHSLDMHLHACLDLFIVKFVVRFGPIFKTSLVGRPIVMSTDAEFNNYIFQQEGKSVDMWYLDAVSKVLDLEGQGRGYTTLSVHKYMRSLALSYIGVDNIRQNFLPHLEDMVHKTLHNWSSHHSVDLRSSASEMISNFTSKLLFSYDDNDKAQVEKLGEMLTRFFDGFLSFPVNIPGTGHYKCLKEGKKVISILRKVVQDRRRRRRKNLSEKPRDLLDQALNDMITYDFLTEDLVAGILLGLTIGGIETLTSTITITVKLISEHPLVLEQLIAENEAILKNRDKSCTSLTWDEYRSSMAFTSQVIKQSLRFGNVFPGLMRKTSKDIQVRGYTIPTGWNIMIVTSALHMNPETYQDPLSFNPWRWKDLDSHTISKNFRPFGGGIRRCVGEEYSKVFLAIFLHVLVTKYRFGPIFKTSVVGRPIVVSADPEFNNYIFQQEMKSVDMWYLDTFSKVFDLEGEGRVHTIHSVHKYIRSLVLSYIGVDNIRQNLLPYLEDMVHKTLHNWSCQESVEVRSSTSEMIFNCTSKLLFSYDDIDKSQDDKLGEMLARFFDGFLSFPVNIPGTAYYKCLKEGKKAFSIIQKLVQDRRGQQNLSEKPRDLLDQALKDMTTNDFLTENVVVYILLGITVGAIESLSSAITVAVKLISEHPLVLEQLIAENEAILNNRDKSCTSLTWDEYRSSMAFTSQVMNESLRFGNVVPGLLRKTSKDIQVKGYTIPAGWIIMIVTSALHMNPETYQDPLSFNPWRWKDLDSHTISKNFRPFGGGVRRCVGEEYGKVFLAIFLHVLVTKYR